MSDTKKSHEVLAEKRLETEQAFPPYKPHEVKEGAVLPGQTYEKYGGKLADDMNVDEWMGAVNFGGYQKVIDSGHGSWRDMWEGSGPDHLPENRRVPGGWKFIWDDLSLPELEAAGRVAYPADYKKYLERQETIKRELPKDPSKLLS